ncbi:hypothetical protein CRYUN_Cryun11dG0102400 [Craigia yunnanensis]
MDEIEIPQYFVCPISLQIMKDPVTVVTGITYDKENRAMVEDCQEHHLPCNEAAFAIRFRFNPKLHAAAADSGIVYRKCE